MVLYTLLLLVAFATAVANVGVWITFMRVMCKGTWNFVALAGLAITVLSLLTFMHRVEVLRDIQLKSKAPPTVASQTLEKPEERLTRFRRMGIYKL